MRKLVIFIIILMLLTGCSLNPLKSSKVNINNINEDKQIWIEKTINLINKGKLDKEKYYDYVTLSDSTISLDDIWRYTEVLYLLDRPLPIKTRDFLLEYNTSDVLEKQKINFLLSLYKTPRKYEIDINSYTYSLLRDSNKAFSDKIESLYYLINFSNQPLKMGEELKGSIEELIFENFKNINEKELGTVFEITFIAETLNFNKVLPLDMAYYKKKFETLLSKNNKNLVDIFYLYFINKFLNSDLNYDNFVEYLSQFKKVDGGYNYKDDKNGNSLTTYIVVKILLDYNPKVLKKVDISSFVNNNRNVDGSYKVLNKVEANITTSLLALLSLKYLGDGQSIEKPSKYLFPNDTLNWRMKFLGYDLVKDQLRKSDYKKLKEEINLTIDQIIEANDNGVKIYESSKVIESLYYISILNKELQIPTSYQFNSICKKLINNTMQNFTMIDPYLLMMVIEIATKNNIELFNKNLVIDYISESFSSNKKIFTVNGREDIIVNYAFIKIMLSLGVKQEGIDYLAVLEKFENASGGYNTTINDQSSSSLSVTLYGLILSKDIYNTLLNDD